MAEPTTATGVVESLTNGNPDGLIALAAGITMAVSAIGTAWAQATIGSAAMGLVAERPEKQTIAIVYLALPETIAILGLVISFLLISKIGGAGKE